MKITTKLLGGALLGPFLASATQGATVLAADGTWSTNQPIPDGFGDNVVGTDGGSYLVAPGSTGVVGTPDITLDFSVGLETYQNWNGRGNVIQAGSAVGTAELITFTPIPSAAVALDSIDLDEWAGGGGITADWSVIGSVSGTLASGTWTGSNAGLRETVALNATGSLGEVLTLSITQTGGTGSYFAVDNLAFDQVPEPSAALSAILGLGAMAMRRRR